MGSCGRLWACLGILLLCSAVSSALSARHHSSRLRIVRNGPNSFVPRAGRSLLGSLNYDPPHTGDAVSERTGDGEIAHSDGISKGVLAKGPSDFILSVLANAECPCKKRTVRRTPTPFGSRAPPPAAPAPASPPMPPPMSPPVPAPVRPPVPAPVPAPVPGPVPAPVPAPLPAPVPPPAPPAVPPSAPPKCRCKPRI